MRHCSFISLFLPAVTAVDPCNEYKNCASCTGARYYGRPVSKHPILPELIWPFKHRPICKWCPYDHNCISSEHSNEGNSSPCTSKKSVAANTYIYYEYSCPLEPPYPNDSSEPFTFLSHWMSEITSRSPSFASLSMSDLSLPGTHDSLSYDLSFTVSVDGVDNFNELNKLLRTLSKTVKPKEVEEFIRLQAKTQQLDIEQQLDNGIRFIDLRIMMEPSANRTDSNGLSESGNDMSNSNHQYDGEWYSIHCLQSFKPAVYYLQRIRSWMDRHSDEIVTIWLSRRGSTDDTGHEAYPDISREQKLLFWKRYLDIFDGIMFDTTISNYLTTEIQDLMRRNHRLISFVSDYEEFTNSSTFAYDAKSISNYFHPEGVFDEEATIKKQRDYFGRLPIINSDVSNKGTRYDTNPSEKWFSLMSMNTPVPTWLVEDSARRRFLPIAIDEIKMSRKRALGVISRDSWPWDSCASRTKIPDSTFCPQVLLDVAQISNYYNQIAIDEAYEDYISRERYEELHKTFPNAFYLDALDINGTIRTGPALLYGGDYEMSKHPSARYAYVDTIISYNIHTVCMSRVFKGRLMNNSDDECKSLDAFIKERRKENPMLLWDEREFGRHESWPS